MQFIFFVPPNEELEGTLHPQKFGCTPKNEGKRVHVPPDEKTCGHTDIFQFFLYDKVLSNNDKGDIMTSNCLSLYFVNTSFIHEEMYIDFSCL